MHYMGDEADFKRKVVFTRHDWLSFRAGCDVYYGKHSNRMWCVVWFIGVTYVNSIGIDTSDAERMATVAVDDF